MNEYRIIHSMKLLAEKPLSINEICYESGFNNFSYFNKTLKNIRRKVLLNTEKSWKKKKKILLNKTFRSNKTPKSKFREFLYFIQIKFEI